MKQAKNLAATTIQTTSSIAMVSKTHRGEALKLTDRQNREIPVRGHLSDLPWLEVGDEVLIVETEEGAVVSGRIRHAGELPAAALSVDEKAMVLMGDRPLRIKIGESLLELHPDGQVRIEGRHFSQMAAGSMQLLSPLIEIN